MFTKLLELFDGQGKLVKIFPGGAIVPTVDLSKLPIWVCWFYNQNLAQWPP